MKINNFYVFGGIISFILLLHLYINFKACDLHHYDFELKQIEKKLSILESRKFANPKIISSKFANILIPVVVIAYNRPSISRCIDSILKAQDFLRKTQPNVDIHLYINQDGDDAETKKVIEDYGSKVFYVNHKLSSVKNVASNVIGYYRLSQHYKAAIDSVFEQSSVYNSIIIIEDDLEVSEDIFSYFYNTFKVLEQDESLYCVSAWNDNGKDDLINVQDTKLIYRSDFFSGLGWLMLKSLWYEIRNTWPEAYWDEFMRLPEVRKSRQCLRPEVPRTSTFGKKGTSGGQFFDTYLQYIHHNESPVNFSAENLSYLNDGYKENFLKSVYADSTKEVKSIQEITPNDTFRIHYSSNHEFSEIAKLFGAMTDTKVGVPRTAVYGVVSLFYKNSRVYISPPPNSWNGYIPD